MILSLIMCGILPILFERINMLWHTGSHNCFPFRYGFIPIFIMLNCGMYYITKYLPCEKKFEKITVKIEEPRPLFDTDNDEIPDETYVKFENLSFNPYVSNGWIQLSSKADKCVLVKA